MTNIYEILLITIAMTLGLLFIAWFMINSTRNFFTRSRYIRIETYMKDKTINVTYIRKNKFNKDNGYLLNPNHIFNIKGYTTIVFTENSSENINPLDFESKFDTRMFQTAIKQNLIEQTFNTLKTNKFDDLKIVLLVSLLTLAGVAYLLIKYMGII